MEMIMIKFCLLWKNQLLLMKGQGIYLKLRNYGLKCIWGIKEFMGLLILKLSMQPELLRILIKLKEINQFVVKYFELIENYHTYIIHILIINFFKNKYKISNSNLQFLFLKYLYLLNIVLLRVSINYGCYYFLDLLQCYSMYLL